MLKGFTISLSLIAAAAAMAAPFTPGNIVVTQIGADDLTTAVGSAGYRQILKEYTPSGTLVQAITLPYSGSGNRFVNSGSATSNGYLTLNAGYFGMIGYNADEGTASINGTSAPRVVALVDMNGNVDISTSLTDAHMANNPRSAVTSDGVNIWTAGTGTPATSGGVRYTTKGSSTSIQVSSSVTNCRCVDIVNGQLYVSTGSGTFKGVNQVGTGLPTTTGTTITTLPGFPDASVGASDSPNYDFQFADANTLYVGDDRATGGVRKFIFSGGTWTFQYLLASTGGMRGLTLTKDAFGNNVLYGVSGESNPDIYTLTDTGASSTWSKVVRSDAAAAANARIRGIRYIPVTGTTISGTLDLNGFVGVTQVPGTFQVEVRTSGGTETKNVTVATDGTYSFVTTKSGAATIWFKGRLWLGKAVSTTISGGAVTVNAALVNGDCTNDNHVDSSDYFILSDAYDTFSGDSAYSAAADLNGDGQVDSTDYFILSDSYEKDGDN